MRYLGLKRIDNNRAVFFCEILSRQVGFDAVGNWEYTHRIVLHYLTSCPCQTYKSIRLPLECFV